jgi:hypothetical protein
MNKRTETAWQHHLYMIWRDFSLTELLVFDRHAGFGRADLGTITAVGAFIGIDYVLGITGGDGFLGAFRQAGITDDTIVGNLIRQIQPPPAPDRSE